MAKLAMRILSKSVASKGAFASAGRVIEKRRSCLKAETIDALLFSRDYQK
ncbi:Ribonuclease H-like domain,HAT, C-terminal dimerisation domain [Cinara cedri]|uniref:Ribonuclease H-like domain,HAT, C-terminal dimerisation domain n=1 Tax=Cinara cedri TaxID=506608 RepID=A0A5E4N7U5_9HEMI|nr:Ribonuclease H-like domain,HAT, C-terminal dimerisation domain [Cinara cedri]